MEMQAKRKERSSMVLNESSTMVALRLTRPLPWIARATAHQKRFHTMTVGNLHYKRSASWCVQGRSVNIWFTNTKYSKLKKVK